MESLLNLVVQSIEQVWLSLQHKWPFLVLSVVIATALKLFIDTTQVSAFLNRHRRAGVIAATGAALAFMTSGAGTSIGVIAGALTFARWRVIALVVGVLWIGAIVSGFAFDLAQSLKLF